MATESKIVPTTGAFSWCNGVGAMLLTVGLLAWQRMKKRLAAICMLAAAASVSARPAWSALRPRASTLLEREVRPRLVMMLEAAKQVIAQQASEILVAVVVQVTSEEKYVNKLLQAFSVALRQGMVHAQFKASLKHVVIESMRFEQLHNEIVGTLTGSMIAASGDKSLRGALLNVITEALKDEGFMSEMLLTMTDATVSAAKNKDLRDSILGVAKIAITDAMKDEGFVADISATIKVAGISISQDQEVQAVILNIGKHAVKEALQDDSLLSIVRETLANSLRDGNIYRGAAAGVVGALNPFGRLRSRADMDNQEQSPEEERDPSDSTSDAEISPGSVGSYLA